MRETVENDPSGIEFVRNTILVNDFCKIASLCGPDCRIIPLKGVSLLFTLYKDDYSRNVGDIDIYVPENKVEEFTGKLSEIGYSLRNAGLNVFRLKSKRKFDMINHNPQKCDLDIHIDLITKKFFRFSTGDFTSFSFNRLIKIQHGNTTINLLNPVDEWLYLSQHYCFHLFAGQKWLQDIWLLQLRFSDEDIADLIFVAKKFNLKRIVTSVVNCLKNNYDNTGIKVPVMITKKHFVFDLLFRKPNLKFAFKGSDRIIAVYWEFLFIDKPGSRINAYTRLLFPDFSMFCNIYSLQSRLLFLLSYPFHVISVLTGSVLFLPLLFNKSR